MGQLSYSNQKFYFHATSCMTNVSARKADFKYNALSLRWETRSAAKAAKLRRYADVSAEIKLKNTFITDLAPPEQIVYPDHLAPHTWQIESAWHCLTRTPAYVADEAGLGKTIVAALCMNSSPGKALITCPPYLKYNWRDEIYKWSKYVDFTIIPDSFLTNKYTWDFLKQKGPFKWLFIDEAHRFKTEDSQRTVALLGDDKHAGITAFAERTVFLSGTPFPNGRPIELWPVLSRVAPESISHITLEAYWKRFCGGKSITRYEGRWPIINRDLQGASNLKDLKRELTQKFMIRHLKKDHLKDLGPKTRQLIFLDQPKEILKLEQRLFKDYSLADFKLDAGLGEIAKYRKQVGLAKLDQAMEYITDLLESSQDQLVVSAYHIEVVEGLFEALEKFQPLKIRGGMTAQDKNKAIKAFQTNSKHRVMVGNTLSMGLGNTLTKASTLVVVEPEWTPGTNEQMEDRIHRISQTKHVYVKYLVLRGSLDERMLRQALGKEDNIQAIMN